MRSHSKRTSKILLFITFFLTGPLIADPCSILYADLVLETSPVKDQCRTGTCWAHAVNSTLEQRIRAKKSKNVSLSEEYLYLRNLTTQAKSNLSDIFEFKTIPENLKDPIDAVQDRSTSYAGYTFGAVPDSVMQSKIITTSRNQYSSAKALLYQRIGDVLRKALTFVSYSPEQEHAARKIELERELSQIEMLFQEKIGGKWREDPDGVSRFEFESEWYSPHEFMAKYIFDGNAPKISYQPASAKSWSELETTIIGTLNKGLSIAVSLHWKDEPEFAWFQKTFGHRFSSHSVEVVGAKVRPGTTEIESYRIKNSWGEDWGDRGEIDIPREEFKKVMRSLTEISYEILDRETFAQIGPNRPIKILN